MAARSIIEVDVKDEAFKNFSKLFQQYREQLAKMPADWQKLNKASSAQNKGLNAAEKELDKSAHHLEKMVKHQDLIKRHSADSLRNTRETGNTFERIAKNAEKTGFQMSKWKALAAGVVGFAGAVIGAASEASSMRRTSGGLGISAGSLQAAESNYSKWIDVQSMLKNIQTGKTDPSSQQHAALSMMGANQSKNVTDLMVEILPKLVAEFKRAGGNQNVLQGMGALSMIGYPELQELSRLNPGELAKASQNLSKDQERFNIDDKSLQKWQEFYMNIEKAATAIKTTFIDGLTPLIPILNKLTNTGTGAIDIIHEQNKKTPALTVVPLASLAQGLLIRHMINSKLEEEKSKQNRSASGKLRILSSGYIPPDSLMARMMKVESNGNPNAVSPKGAQGPLQFMPNTGKQYGVKNPFDITQEIAAWKAYMSHLLKLYAGDVRKAVAAYNWGEGNLNKDITKNGANWDKHLPQETSRYLTKVLVMNNTGGSAIVSSSQLPY